MANLEESFEKQEEEHEPTIDEEIDELLK